MAYTGEASHWWRKTAFDVLCVLQHPNTSGWPPQVEVLVIMAHLFRRTLVMPDHLSDAMDHMHDKGRHRISARPALEEDSPSLRTEMCSCVEHGGTLYCLRRRLSPMQWGLNCCLPQQLIA